MPSGKKLKKRAAAAAEVETEGAVEVEKKKKKRKAAAAAEVEAQVPEVSEAAEAVEAAPRKKKKRKLADGAAADVADAERAADGADAADAAGDAAADGAGEGKRSGKKLKKIKEMKAKAAAAEEAAKPAAVVAEEVDAAVDSTVFVDGVPYDWSIAQIEEHFASCGKVASTRAPTWQDSGRLRGFAHVTFTNTTARDKALAMDGSKVGDKGRYLKIEAAKAPGKDAELSKNIEGMRRLFVKNLPYDATEAEIGKLFSKHGKINEVRIPTSMGRSKGFAYVEFSKADGLKSAVEMQPGPEIRGRFLRLDVDTGNGPKAGFHARPEAYDSGFGPGRGGGKGDGKGKGMGRGGGGKDGGKGKGKDGGKSKGKDGGKGKGKPGKLSLF